MVKPRTIACALAALTLTVAGAAQVPLRSTKANPLYPRESIAIAGVKLGMTPAEVAAAARAAGYKRTVQNMGDSWDARIAYLVALNRSVRIPGSGRIVRHEEYRKGEELLQVEYYAKPAGPVVSAVRYDLGNDAIDPGVFRQAALERYGVPTRPGDSEMYYCSMGEVDCMPPGIRTQEPHLIVDIPLRAVTLNMGNRLRREHDAAERAEMDRRAPKVKRPTF